MFTNAIICRLKAGGNLTAAGVEDALATARFLPCGPTQASSSGWIPPRGHEHGPLAEIIAGQTVLKLCTETKAVPAEILKRNVEERVARYKQETGHERVGKKIKKEFQEEALLDLLPQAFAKRSATMVWIDPIAGTVVIDAGSLSSADRVVSALVQAIDGLSVQPLQPAMSPGAAMAHWLGTREAPAGFTVDRECELKMPDDQKSTVRYSNHTLEIDEVAQHIAAGKIPTRLALTWNDRVSFVLTDAMTLKKLRLLDVVLDDKQGDAADGFDADVAIATGELRKLIEELVEALGGEMPARDTE